MRFTAVAIAALATGALAHWKKPVDQIPDESSSSLPAPTGPAPSGPAPSAPAQSSVAAPPAEWSSAPAGESSSSSAASPSVTTEVIDVWTTFCPSATTLTLGTETYTVTEVCSQFPPFPETIFLLK